MWSHHTGRVICVITSHVLKMPPPQPASLDILIWSCSPEFELSSVTPFCLRHVETFLGISIFSPEIQKFSTVLFLDENIRDSPIGFPVLTGNSGPVWSNCRSQGEFLAPSWRLAKTLNHIYSSINEGHVKPQTSVVCVGFRVSVIKVPVWIFSCSEVYR